MKFRAPADQTTLPDETTVGASIVVNGLLQTESDLTLAGQVIGEVWCEGAVLTVAGGSQITGDVVARDVTIHGQVEGQIIATDVVDIRRGADVRGRIIAPRLVLEDGAWFHGRVEPQHLDTAIRVARFQRQKRDAAG